MMAAAAHVGKPGRAGPADKGAGERTRENLILAAERLVAELGLGGASAREIARNAGLKNNVSVQYHFGSLDNLLDQVVHYRMALLEEIRSAMLAALDEAAFLALDIAQLWTFVCVPQLEMRGADGRFQYAAYLCNYLPVRRPEGFSAIMRTASAGLPALSRVLQRLRSLLADLPQDTYDRRVTSANLLFLNTCRGLEPADLPAAQLIAQNPLVRDAFRQSVAALTVPWMP